MLLEKLRTRASDESGFTLIELLVVMLILGILAAIAIPSFFNQREKAQDADAKSAARTAQTAIETYATDNGGSYLNATVGILQGIEQTLTGRVLSVASTANTYKVTSESKGSNKNQFSIERKADGTTVLSCTTMGKGGCPTNGDWGGSTTPPPAGT